MKNKIKEIIILIIFIAIVSSIAINIKDTLSKDELANIEETKDLANTIDTNIDELVNGENKEAVVDENQIIQEQIKEGVFAVIDIPTVGVRGKVVEGTDDETLKNYIGMFKGCNLPGEYGNFSVAAHNNIYTEIFKNLHKVNVNDKVRVITKDYEYIYIVKSVEEISPRKTEVLDADYSKREITLITCTDLGRTRICVKGDLISQNVIK